MGMEHTSTIVIGYVFDRDDLDDRFLVEIPAKTHEEVRYNEITGEKYTINVADGEAKCVYRTVVAGKLLEADSCDEFLELVFPDHNVTTHGDFCRGDLVYAVEPSTYAADESFTLNQVVKLMGKCDKIREIALEKLNMEIGEPRVMSLSSYG